MDYIKIFVDFAEVMEPLTFEERGRLLTAMLQYAEDGTIPELEGNERFLWGVAKRGIDREVEQYSEVCKARKEAGRRGAEARWNGKSHDENGKNGKCYKSHGKNSKNGKEEDEEEDKEEEKIIKESKEKRHKYGEYKNVLLSDEELEKLKAEFPDYLQRIERLSEYIAKTGKSYNSHLATIRSWARSEKKEPEKPQKEWMRRYIGGTK